MEQLKKCRKVMRALFTRSANSLQTLLNDEVDLREIETAWCMLQERQLSLKEADKQVFDAYVTADVNEDVLTAELTSCEEYTNTFMRLNVQCSHILHPKEKFGTGRASSELQLTPSVEPCKLKLPAIEFKRFGGDVKDWLPFWTQFTKIHEDDNLVPEDKFQFLIQATIVGSRARELVESFPPTRDNYVKAIDSLKSRFGREDVLIEVYVRELLKIVLNNALSKGSKMALCTLYDRIETQLRALETLGITTDKCAAMLYPLVESCLPAELLRAWQRSSNFSSEHKPKNRLDSLIKFVKSEVESEERISLAVAGFGINTSEKTEEKIKKTKITESSIPTAAGLLSCEVRKCVFCDGAHANDDCFKARKMSFEEKRKILTEKQMCFRCLKIGHQSRKCRSKLSCILCSKPHAVIMCSQLPVNRKDAKQEKKIEETVNGFANCSDTHVFMQTMRVNLCNNHGEREIRVLIDTGSQCSYILKTTAEEFKYPVLRRKKIIHALFGGVNTNEQEHCCYNVQLVSLDKKYVCKLDVLDQPLICGRISSVFQGPWLNELHKLNIKLTDLKDSDPIELLIGADIVGKLLTGRRHILECGLVVVETLLGWTLMGKVPLSPTRSQTTMIVMSNFVKEMSVEELWKLDVLGITDPIEKRQKQELEAEAKELFDRTVCVNKERRYEVKMPWLECHPPLPTNYSIAKKRLDVTIKKLETDGRKDEYEKVFQNWLDEGIIEVVTEKAWICLFTCGVYRAVHLELVTTLSTNNFIQALRRFIARRGRPKTIYSDNGTNFIGTNNALESLNWNEILRYSSVERITWRFNPPSAPWWGGWWERLIGILKRLLRRVLGKASVDYEEMVTILCDCENIVNSRPLTYVSENPQDLRPLTPSMYLRDLVEDGVPDCDAIDCSSLNRRIRYVQKLRVELRSRFRTEYLGQLKQSPGRRKILHKITVGDIVIIGNDSSKRLDWPLGRVVEVLPGKDGETRLVRVETKRGQLLRPVQRIYPLESVGNSNPVPESSSESAGVLKSRVPDNNSESAGVPKKQSTRCDKKWPCGPNSGQICAINYIVCEALLNCSMCLRWEDVTYLCLNHLNFPPCHLTSAAI